MREYEVTCPQCGQQYRVNEPMLQTLRQDGCAVCRAPFHERARPA